MSSSILSLRRVSSPVPSIFIQFVQVVLCVSSSLRESLLSFSLFLCRVCVCVCAEAMMNWLSLLFWVVLARVFAILKFHQTKRMRETVCQERKENSIFVVLSRMLKNVNFFVLASPSPNCVCLAGCAQTPWLWISMRYSPLIELSRRVTFGWCCLLSLNLYSKLTLPLHTH